METILCYNFSEKELKHITLAALRCGALVRPVAKESYGVPLRDLLGSGGTGTASGSFDERMLVLCHLHDSQVDGFLRALQVAELPTGILKAVLTETNQAWTSLALYRELCAERAAIQAQRGE